MHSSVMRIALLLAMAIAASVAATWAKSYFAAAADRPHPTHLLSGQPPSPRHG